MSPPDARRSGLRVCVDARPLDIGFLRSQGIGRVAHSLLGPLAEVAAERGGELVLLRQGTGSAYGQGLPIPEGAPVVTRRVRRPPVPGRLADLPEQILVPLDVRRARADVVHALSPYRAALRPGAPSVITVHDVIPLMWPERYLRTGLVHRLLYRAVRRATRLVAVSERARRDVVEHLGVDPERIDVARLAADPRFRPTEPAGIPERLGIREPYVLYVGGLASEDPRKDVGGLIDGFARWTAARGREETLVLAGREGPAAAALAERARGSGARIAFTGFVAEQDLPALYSGARCLVTASRYEGFGLPPLEALACGTPVAAFDAGAIPEVSGPGAICVPVGDHGALMDAVQTLCDDEEERARLARAGLARAGELSWRRTAERTWEAYERAAAT